MGQTPFPFPFLIILRGKELAAWWLVTSSIIVIFSVGEADSTTVAIRSIITIIVATAKPMFLSILFIFLLFSFLLPLFLYIIFLPMLCISLLFITKNVKGESFNNSFAYLIYLCLVYIIILRYSLNNPKYYLIPIHI